MRTIAIDESQKGNVFVLLALEATENQETFIALRLTELRKQIKAQLFKDAPRLINHPKLLGNQLPELHAERLIQSGEYYRLELSDPGYRKNYWLRQFEWYEKALKIIIQSNCIAYFLIDIQNHSEIENTRNQMIEALADASIKATNRRFIKIEKKVGSLAVNPYFLNFPAFIATLENVSNSDNIHRRIIADYYDQCKGFSEDSAYKILRQFNLMKHLSTPRHLSSEDEVLVQAADLIAYVICAYTVVKQEDQIGEKASLCRKYYRLLRSMRLLDIEQLTPPNPETFVSLYTHMIGEVMGNIPNHGSALKEAMNHFGEAVTGVLIHGPKFIRSPVWTARIPNHLDALLNPEVSRQYRRLPKPSATK